VRYLPVPITVRPTGSMWSAVGGNQTDLFHSVSSSPAGYFLRHTTVANPPGNGDRTGLNEIKRGCTGVKMPDDTVTQAISANGTAEPRPELEIDRNKERD